MQNDGLGDRMKAYEGIEANRLLIPNLPIICRLDAKAFHTWTRSCARPFDFKLQELFDRTAQFLVEKTNAVVAYTQSDEITLILWNYNKPESEVMFNGRTQKLTSVLASMTTAYFNSIVPEYFDEKPLAFFDCRVFNVPTLEEAVNNLI